MKKAFLYILLLQGCTVISPAIFTQECTIYTIPSPKGINWKSPTRLLFSYLNNYLCRSRYKKEKHPIGHMMVELKDSSRHIVAGVSSVPGSGMAKGAPLFSF